MLLSCLKAEIFNWYVDLFVLSVNLEAEPVSADASVAVKVFSHSLSHNYVDYAVIVLNYSLLQLRTSL